MEDELKKWIQNRKAIEVKVKPNSKKTIALEIKDNVLLLAISAPPEDGKANAEVERFLSKLSGRKATIKRGHTGKEKLVQFS